MAASPSAQVSILSDILAFHNIYQFSHCYTDPIFGQQSLVADIASYVHLETRKATLSSAFKVSPPMVSLAQLSLENNT